MGKQVNELDALSEFTDDCVLPTHNGVGLKKGTIGALTEYLGTKFSNPNLLINPDFAINQRGQSSYEINNNSMYTVDRWKVWNAKVTKLDKGIKLENNYTLAGTLIQILEDDIKEECTASCYVESITGVVYLNTPNGNKTVLKKGLNKVTFDKCGEVDFSINPGASVVIYWAKLEKGANNTLFVKPDSVTEYIKCEHFYKIVSIGAGYTTSVGTNSLTIPIMLKTKMRSTPTINFDRTDIYIEPFRDGDTSSKTLTIQSGSGFHYINEYIGELSINAPSGFTRWTMSRFINNLYITLDAEIY